MHSTIAEDAYVGCIEEIGHAMRFGDLFLSIIRETITTCSERLQEAVLQFRVLVGQGAQPSEVLIPASATHAWQRPAVCYVKRRQYLRQEIVTRRMNVCAGMEAQPFMR